MFVTKNGNIHYYINLSGKEHFKLFSANPDLTGFENGKLYEIEKLLPIIKESETISYDENGNKLIGGSGGKEDSVSLFPWVIAGVVIFIIVVIAVSVIRKEKK